MKYFLFSFLLALPACGGLLSTSAPSSPQELVNEANILIISTANVVAQNEKEGIFTKAEARGYLVELEDIRKKVRTAQAFIDAGSPLAKGNAELVKTLIIQLHKTVSERARR